jgi:hypothetical protein
LFFKFEKKIIIRKRKKKKEGPDWNGNPRGRIGRGTPLRNLFETFGSVGIGPNSLCLGAKPEAFNNVLFEIFLLTLLLIYVK